MAHRNFITHNRKWVVVKRHAPLIIKPSIIALCVDIVWRYTVCQFNLSYGKEAENPILFIILTFTAFIYAIIAGYAVNAVFSDYKEISKAVVRNDMETFLQYRDEQLPILIHLLVGMTSVFMVLFTMFFPYSSRTVGYASVFVITFMVTFVYYIICELDDYQHSIWFKERIPKHWYTEDIQAYFKNKIQKATVE